MFKVFFFSLLFLSMQVNAAGVIKMPTDTIPPIDKPIDYKAKSKRQLTTAIVMVSVGGATIVVSAFGYFIAKSEDMVAEMFVPYPEKTKKDAYAIAGLCGAALALALADVFVKAAAGKVPNSLNQGAHRRRLGSISPRKLRHHLPPRV